MYRRRLSFCFLFLLALLLFAGCGADAPDGTSVPQTPADPAPESITLAADGQCLFSVLRPESATEAEINLAVSLRQTAGSFFGSLPDIDTDWTIPKGIHSPDGFEILIGRTEAEESKAVYADLPYGSCTVRAVGDKLVVAGWMDEAYPLLQDMLLSLLSENTENGICTIPADYSDTRQLDENPINIPPFNGYVDSVVDLDDGSYMLYLEKANASDMEAYCGILRDAGYTLYTEHTAADNKFATYVGEENNIHVYYTPCYRTLRIVIDPEGAPLPARAGDVPAFREITAPRVNMIGLNNTGNENNAIGLFMAFLLPNGEFIVVDGGFTIPDAQDYVYKRLRELAPDPDNMVIASWYLTHAHSDHTPGFYNFVSRHHMEVRIRQVVLNFTRSDRYDLRENTTTEVAIRAILKLLPETDIVKAHTGQVFHYPGASVEMLFTFDDYLPLELPYVNATSLIFRVTLGGQTVMVTGDASEHITSMACSMYGSYLKSDIVQMSHHGGDGATPEFYTLISPHTALWPAGETKYRQNLNRECNKTLLKIVQDMYVARYDVITLPLPYTPVGNNTPTAAP